MSNSSRIVLSLVVGGCCFGVNAQEKNEDNDKLADEDHIKVEDVLILGFRSANYTELTEDTRKLVEMPGSLGDPLAAITALPGVITPSSGGQPAVRGSSPSDNRYYVDGMPAGYIFHEFNTSIFDENVVQDFELFSAGYGAQYSNVTGAVFDIRLRDPENKPVETTVNVSLLRAGLFVESGVTDSSAFYFSIREGLIQHFLPEDTEANDEGIRIITAPADDDYQLKYKWDVNDKHKLTLSLTGASDFTEVELNGDATFVQENPDFEGEAQLDKRFDSQSINWYYKATNGSNLTLTLANYKDEIDNYWGDDYFDKAETKSSLARAQYSFPASDYHTIAVGTEYDNQTFDYNYDIVLFVCSEFDPDCQAGRRQRVQDNQTIDLLASSTYLVDNWQISPSFNIEAGVQYSTNDYTDESFTNPRIAAAWRINDTYTLTATSGAYNRIPSKEFILPAIGNPELESETAEHFTLGLKSEMSAIWSWNVELYHKEFSNLPFAIPEDQSDAELLYSNDIEGEANGVDFMLNRNYSDRWYGWLSLSYAESERTNSRDGRTQKYAFDTPFVLNAVGNYQISQRWNGGFRLTVKSGEASTKIIGIRPNPNAPDHYLPVYDEPFADRLPMYARLDLKFSYAFTMFDNDASAYLEILNALNRENVTAERLDYERVNETGELFIESAEDLEIFPSIGIRFTF